MPDPMRTPPDSTFGSRVRRARERKGQTRSVLAGLVGRSAEWVKAIETGRLQAPRLPLLLRMADALGIEDLAELTGNERLTAATYTKTAHSSLDSVKQALTSYRFCRGDEEPCTPAELDTRLRHAWHMWHSPGPHRTRIAQVLPDLLRDTQHAARTLEGRQRRQALVALAQTYHLAQLFLAYQPTPELVYLTGDRSMNAAQDADSPHAIAAAAWYMNHVFRSGGERNEARIELTMRAAELLQPSRDTEDQALWGLMHLAAALSYAKSGSKGDAERHWDRADEAARRLGEGYVHPWLLFGRGVVDAYAITMKVDLMRGREAVETVGRVDLSAIPSATRRSGHLIESARAHSMQGESVAVVHLLKKAVTASPETARFNLFARSAVTELRETAGPMIRDDVTLLSQELGIPA
ncbi:multiprotein-bridging factor 1 family protein [Streptomyces sp. NPDC001922]|uniref:helix-turn-helix domain-containing protein n=1 Tax=Streptomyces sp. NPDC001922 TaxID=3364624 RepID=UPI0036AF051A